MRKTKEQNRIDRELRKIEMEKNQRPVKALTISIEWKKSRTWGHNPHATAAVEYHDGTFERREGYKCSGCGYDKASTVVAEVFDDFLKYKLWEKIRDTAETGKRNWRWLKENKKWPYGIVADRFEDSYDYRYYSGGIGISCFPAISEFIGGKFETVASGESFDVYRYTDLQTS